MKSGGVHPDRRTWLLVLFWAEVLLAAASAVLAMTTAIHPDWIESLTGLDPDSAAALPSGPSL